MKTLEQIIEEAGNTHWNEDVKTGISYKTVNAIKVDNLKSQILAWVESEIIGEDESIGLPVTQAQEQDNYNKKQRNKLRIKQRQAIKQFREGIKE